MCIRDSSKGIRVVISTSGVTITEQYAKELKDRGLDCCYVSLNGSTAEIHEITRDGYEFTINALKIFKEIGLVTAINWVAGHDNINDLEKLIGFAKNLGVRHISCLLYTSDLMRPVSALMVTMVCSFSRTTSS